MSYDVVKELVNQFEKSNIREMNVSIEGVSLYLSKNNQNSQNTNQDNPDVISKHEEVKVPSVISNNEVSEIVTETIPGNEITSPIVGVVYTASEPGKAPFVSVGDKVSEGDTLCIIEAMKLMNDVKSTMTGTITEILIENEQIVEFGQPLFRIS